MDYVALLRGINVGGKHKIDMKQLKATFERAGMEAVQTYINSGNVIFRPGAVDRAKLASVLEGAIEAAFGVFVPVFVRDAQAFLTIAGALPECWVDGKEAKCDVIFLSDAVDGEGILERLPIKPGIDEVRYVPGAVLWRVNRSVVTRSGLMRIVGTELYQHMTVRNCNTVRRIGELLKARAAEG